MTYKKILIAVDASEYSMAAARKGLELSHQLGAAAALVFVVDTAMALGNVDAGIGHEESLIVLKKEAEQTLDQLAAMYNGAELFKFMPQGHPQEEILKTAEVWGADLIVIGTHGRVGFMHLLLGSNAERIVHRSNVPVMVVPARS